MFTDDNNEYASAARERFEALIPEIFDQEKVMACVVALEEVRQNGGCVSDADWQRVFPHLKQVDERVRAIMALTLQLNMSPEIAE